MGYYDFPHTRNYDSDLGFLIQKYIKLNKDYETLLDIYNVVKTQITDITLQQLKQWLDDGTLEKIINDNILNNKTNITEFKQNRIQGICRTYGMWEKGANAWFTTNDFNVRPGVSGITPSVQANSYDSRDSVALGAFGLGNPPLIDENISSFTNTTVTLPNLNIDKIIDPLHQLKISDLDFSDTLVDIFINGTRSYYGFVNSFNPTTKTFTLNPNTGFFKVNSGDLSTYTPPNNSQVIIGNITAVWGANIIAQDKTDLGPTNVHDLCGMELMVINNNNSSGCRNLHLVASGNYPNAYFILGDGAQPTKVGAYLTNITERGVMLKAHSTVTNYGNIWLLGLQGRDGSDVFHIDGNGKQTNLGVNSAGVGPNSGNGDGYLNPQATIFILTDSTPHWLDYADVMIDGKILILCNHGTTVTHQINQGLGGVAYDIAPGKVRILTWVPNTWYPVLYTDLK